uniref:Nuclease HARBI1 n=1 Tax=Cajanus cajan TaxID=3821 RepID=A0A151RQ19_CAJCA|nr:hypothetical protein KK1_033846 [Cajanus cajan]
MPTSRSIGQKATKRKAKGKETSNTNVVDFSGIENAIKEKNAYASRLIELKEAQERRLTYEIIMKDTSNMNETQREAHEKSCNYLKQQYGNHDEYFQMRLDATRRRDLSPLQKCTTALRMLAYETPADFADEYIRIGETTVVKCLQRFVKGICEIFRDAAIMKNIIYACIILHNMIVEDERDTYQNYIDYDGVDDDMSRSEISIDLIEHIWERFRNNNDEN